MKAEAPRPRWLKFDPFTADLQTGELRKGYRVVKLQPQPFKLLVLLASRSGEVIGREEIQKELWSDDTVVDFEHGRDSDTKGDELALSFSYTEGFLPVLRVYLLGLLSARLGENEKALEFATKLESLPEPKHSPRFPVDWRQMMRDMVRTIHAFVAYNDARKQEALALLEQQQLKGRTTRFPLENGFLLLHPIPPRAFVIDIPIDLRAQILEELGRYDEALGWYSWKWGLAYLRSARIYEKLGNPEKAIEKYSRFVADWTDCDPELRHFVEEAEARLAQLQGEGT